MQAPCCYRPQTPLFTHSTSLNLQVLHALGFTSALFSSFVDPATLLELPLSRVQRQVTLAGGRRVTRVVTPTVRREARAQFGCSTLDGAQLEDEGGSGSANAHW